MSDDEDTHESFNTEDEEIDTSQLRSKLKKRDETIDELQEKLNMAASLGTQLFTENERLKEELADLEDAHAVQRSKLEGELDEAQKAVEKATRRMQLLDEQATASRNALDSTSVANAQLNDRVKELERSLDLANKEIARFRELNDKLDILNTSLNDKEDEAAELEAQRKQQRSHIAALEAENQQLKAALNALNEDEQKKADDTRAATTKKIAAYEEKVKEMEQLRIKLDDSENENQQLREHVTKLGEANQTLSRQHNETQALLDEVQKTTAELKLAMEESIVFNNRDDGQHVLSDPEYDQMVAENAKKEEILKQLAKKLSAAEHSLGIKHDEVSKLQEKLSERESRQKEGYLYKQGTFWHTWKRYFFFLEGDHLYYAINEHVPFAGYIPLRGAWAELDSSQGKSFAFRIKTRDEQTMFLCADTENEMVDWLVLIKKRIQRSGTMLEEIKEVVKDILSDCDQDTVFQDDNYFVTKLCYLLERSLTFGLKPVNFFSATTFWDFILNLKDIFPESREALENVKSLMRSSHGRGRVFIRLALNNGNLVNYLTALSEDKKLTEKYYEEFALMRNENTSMFMMLLENFRVLNFALFLKEKALENQNYWDTVKWETLKKHHKTERAQGAPAKEVTQQLDLLQRMEKL